MSRRNANPSHVAFNYHVYISKQYAKLAWGRVAWLACAIQPTYTRMLQSKALWHRPSGTISLTRTLSITPSLTSTWPPPPPSSLIYSRQQRSVRSTNPHVAQSSENAFRDTSMIQNLEKRPNFIFKRRCRHASLASSQTCSFSSLSVQQCT